MQIRLQRTSIISSLQVFIDEWLILSLSQKMKFAIKVSLSLMFAFMIPLAMGWAQAQTAAITVMLIATAGHVSESLVKGAMRLLGTVIGGVIGLSLIAMFPQDRLVYLTILSILVPFILYLYHAYQGDSTSFMLMGMMIMMVFKGGEVDDAFLYGIDRVYMTLFGIVVYTLVGLFLWPVKEEDTTAKDASVLSGMYGQYFTDIVSQHKNMSDKSLLESMLNQELKLQKTYSPNFQTSHYEKISSYYQELGDLLKTFSIQMAQEKKISYSEYIQDYDKSIEKIRDLFNSSQEIWKGSEIDEVFHYKPLVCVQSVCELPLLRQAAIYSHKELLNQLNQVLNFLLQAQKNLEQNASLKQDISNETQEHSNFIWSDPEYIKAALQVFLIYWIATIFWILMHPPGGFLLVTLATMLSVFTAFSPLKPSVLSLLFSFGFVFALVSYVFILPHLVYAWELALFIFMYTFIAFYLINEKISVFFLIGLFTLGISNTMSYNFDVFLMILLAFYLFLTILMLFYYIPFSSKPEYLFLLMNKRVFEHAKKLLAKPREKSMMSEKMKAFHLVHLKQSLSKLHLWAGKIDEKYFTNTRQEDLSAYTTACSDYVKLLAIFIKHENKLKTNKLYNTLKDRQEDYLLAEFSDLFSQNDPIKIKQFVYDKEDVLFKMKDRFYYVQASIEDNVYNEELSDIYINIDLRHSLWMALKKCAITQEKIDMQNLTKSRF